MNILNLHNQPISTRLQIKINCILKRRPDPHIQLWNSNLLNPCPMRHPIIQRIQHHSDQRNLPNRFTLLFS